MILAFVVVIVIPAQTAVLIGQQNWKQRYLQQNERNTAEIRVCFGLSFATLFLFLATQNGIRNKELCECYCKIPVF